MIIEQSEGFILTRRPTHEDIDILLDQAITRARDHFYTFVQLMAPLILPEKFEDGRHIEIICAELQNVEASVADPKRKPDRLQLFLPPGSMKSKLASNLFPAWCLGRHPQWCFLALGSDFEFAVDNFGRPTKDLVDLDEYQAIFPFTILRKDVQGAGRWDTTRKGRFVARGAGQNIAGRRAHIAICDDVITEQTTDLEREKINKWYQKGLRTRLLPQGAEIIINTRWHLEDLSGYTVKLDSRTKRPWRVVSIPAILDEAGRELLWREGDPEGKYDLDTSFWPEFWPTDVLLEKKETLPPGEWNALYMQSPTSESGNIVKRSQFKIWPDAEPPSCQYILVSMDTAFGIKETNDFSAYSVWGIFSKESKNFEQETIRLNCTILLAAGKGRWEFPELCEKAQWLDTKYKPDFFIIEDRASGQSLIQEMMRRGLPIVPFMPEKDKVFRLHACTPFFQSGRVWVPLATDKAGEVIEGKLKSWAEELVEEVISFPSCPHDDLTDTVSQAILWLKNTYNLENDGYPTDPFEPDDYYLRGQKKGNTYWSSVMGIAEG